MPRAKVIWSSTREYEGYFDFTDEEVAAAGYDPADPDEVDEYLFEFRAKFVGRFSGTKLRDSKPPEIEEISTDLGI